MRHVPGRFQAGISLTGREARTVMGRLAGGMVLPLPFHSLVVALIISTARPARGRAPGNSTDGQGLQVVCSMVS